MGRRASRRGAGNAENPALRWVALTQRDRKRRGSRQGARCEKDSSPDLTDSPRALRALRETPGHLPARSGNHEWTPIDTKGRGARGLETCRTHERFVPPAPETATCNSAPRDLRRGTWDLKPHPPPARTWASGQYQEPTPLARPLWPTQCGPRPGIWAACSGPDVRV